MQLPPQDKDFINEAYALFDEFYSALTPLRQKCRQNEEFWKANHWHDISKKETDESRPVTPVIFSTLESLLSDIMDNYPQAVILGEEAGDEQKAASLQDILRYILKRRNYRTTYRDKCRQALQKGTSVQEVFWDGALYSGLGDVSIRPWDIKNFLYDPKCEDIQQGRAVFKFGFYQKSYFTSMYPGAWDMMRRDSYARETACGAPDSAKDESLLIEYWYKKYDAKTGGSTVHMAKLSGGVLLEKSEIAKKEGMYHNGLYPFIIEALYKLEGQPVGLGIVDILKNLQQYADKLDQIILKNALMSGKLKMLINRNADIEEDALTDWSREVVRASRIDEGAVRWFSAQPLNPYVLSHFQGKLAAIKEESGQTQFLRGETMSGITAASAILALQEAGSKRSRLLIDQLYDGFEQLIRLIIDMIRENYTEEQVILINGGKSRQVKASSGLLIKKNSRGNRSIDFDICVAVEKQTPYKTLYQNELAMNLLKAGVINAVEALEMMSFEGRDKVLESVKARAVLGEALPM